MTSAQDLPQSLRDSDSDTSASTSISALANALVREYLSRKGLKKTLETLREEEVGRTLSCGADAMFCLNWDPAVRCLDAPRRFDIEQVCLVPSSEY
jgi:hypothetical protein